MIMPQWTSKLVKRVTNGEVFYDIVPIQGSNSMNTQSAQNVPHDNAHVTALELPSMNFNDQDEGQYNYSGQAEVKTDDGVPILDLPSMTFDKPQQNRAKPKTTTSEPQVLDLPKLKFDAQ